MNILKIKQEYTLEDKRVLIELLDKVPHYGELTGAIIDNAHDNLIDVFDGDDDEIQLFANKAVYTYNAYLVADCYTKNVRYYLTGAESELMLVNAMLAHSEQYYSYILRDRDNKESADYLFSVIRDIRDFISDFIRHGNSF